MNGSSLLLLLAAASVLGSGASGCALPGKGEAPTAPAEARLKQEPFGKSAAGLYTLTNKNGTRSTRLFASKPSTFPTR